MEKHGDKGSSWPARAEVIFESLKVQTVIRFGIKV